MAFLNDPKSPIWNLLRLVLVLAALALVLNYAYKNSWSVGDWKTMLAVALSLGLFDWLKRYLTLPGDEE